MQKEATWYDGLSADVRDLVDDSSRLLELARNDSKLKDFAFVVFPIAKAYEGFVKKFLLQMGLITETQYKSNHFRIGKSLNPSLDLDERNDWWVYERLAGMCSDELAQTMWEAWRLGRNKLFHYFGDHTEKISLQVAEERMELIIKAISLANSCKVNAKES